MSKPNGNRMRVVALLQEGLTDAEICARLGIAQGTVSSYGTWARREGLLPCRRDPGRPRSILHTLPPAVRRWLAEQVPTGGSVEEFVAAIILDAYHEEMGK
jgi:transposase